MGLADGRQNKKEALANPKASASLRGVFQIISQIISRII
jgi:hypothetical protein